MITENNYYDEHSVMSVSQYEAWLKCPKSAHAQYVTGEYSPEPSEAMQLGTYMHAMFEGAGATRAFTDTHDILLKSGKNKGKPSVKYARAVLARERAMQDEVFMQYMTGKKEKIYTGEFAGIEWKIKVDCINEDRMFASDLKYIASISEEKWEKYWFDEDGNLLTPEEASNHINPHKKNLLVPFYEKYRYWTRTALYWQILYIATGNRYQMFLPCISKEEIPDIEVFDMNNIDRFIYELKIIEQEVPKILQMKENPFLIEGCGHCEYCRSQKKLTGLKEAESVI